MVRCSVLGCKSDSERKLPELSFHSDTLSKGLLCYSVYDCAVYYYTMLCLCPCWKKTVFREILISEMAERAPVSAEDTLVRYDNPVLVTKHPEKQVSPRTQPVQPCIPTEAKRETEEILNAILPPKEWEEGGQIWTQKISSTPATRLDVINLQEMLDTRLQQRQARETGICPVRRQLYTQCFDELIRQVTINCGERGLLLLRVRDEARITMEAYQTLYCSSIAFGMRKALQSEQGKSDLMEQVAKLEQERAALERLCSELKQKTEQLERRAAELRAAEEKRHQEELTSLKKTNAQLKAQLEGIIAPKK